MLHRLLFTMSGSTFSGLSMHKMRSKMRPGRGRSLPLFIQTRTSKPDQPRIRDLLGGSVVIDLTSLLPWSLLGEMHGGGDRCGTV
jgi:hypothetical protein